MPSRVHFTISVMLHADSLVMVGSHIVLVLLCRDQGGFCEAINASINIRCNINNTRAISGSTNQMPAWRVRLIIGPPCNQRSYSLMHEKSCMLRTINVSACRLTLIAAPRPSRWWGYKSLLIAQQYSTEQRTMMCQYSAIWSYGIVPKNAPKYK